MDESAGNRTNSHHTYGPEGVQEESVTGASAARASRRDVATTRGNRNYAI
jgi:hypothetical protein